MTSMGRSAGSPGEASSGRSNRTGRDKARTASIWSTLKQLGPGLITGASDDDPSGIATYSQAGARFGFAMLWTLPFSFPLMAAIQEICARIGRVTGRGIAANLRQYYPAWVAYSLVTLMSGANVFNLGADLAAMGDAARLLLPGNAQLYAVGLCAISVLAELFIPYSRYARYLKWLTLSLAAYVVTTFLVQVPWPLVASATFTPHIEISKDYLVALTAVLGTTISPYLFFWQASQEVEDLNNNPQQQPLKRAPAQASEQLGRIRIDTYVGMALSNLVAYFIVLTAASTLHAHGAYEISTSAEAAIALRPLAGKYAFLLFVCGIIGTGLLAVPVLAGAAAFGIGETRRWKVGLQRKPREAIRFYAVIAAATIVGLGMNFAHIQAMKALYWAAVLNGLAAAPLMAAIMIMAVSRHVMGQFQIPRALQIVGWGATACMLCSGIAALYLMLVG